MTESADAVAEPQVLQQRVEGVERDRLGGRARAAAGHHVDQVEHAEGVERAEDERDENRRLEQRQRHVPELPPGGGAVDARRLVERGVDVLQPGEQQQRDERRGLPDVGEDHRHPGEVGSDEPDRRLAHEAQAHQQRVRDPGTVRRR